MATLPMNARMKQPTGTDPAVQSCTKKRQNYNSIKTKDPKHASKILITKEFMWKINPAVKTKLYLKKSTLKTKQRTILIMLNKSFQVRSKNKRARNKQARNLRTNNKTKTMPYHRLPAHLPLPLHLHPAPLLLPLKCQPLQKSAKSDHCVRSLIYKIQMQYSKGERTQYTQSQIVKKLEKIKQEISSAEDYLRLQKCSTKLQKIHELAAAQPNKKARKELRMMVQVCDGLIKEKTKYFKKKILQQLSNKTRNDESNSKEKTLKYSKSVENFQMLPTQMQPGKRKPLKTEEEQLWADRTEVQGKNQQRLEQVVEKLREEVNTYKYKVQMLEKPSHVLTYRLNQQQTVFEQETNFKLKEKGHEIEELKGRLKYFQQTNQELRNRLNNQQKRQDDYIGSLKSHISKLNQQIQLLGRENRKLQDQLTREMSNNNDLQLQLRRYAEQAQYLHREKRQRQQSEVLKMKDSGIRKQLISLSQQEKYIREMESMLQNEKEEKGLMQEQMEGLKKKNKALIEEVAALEIEKQRLKDIIDIDCDQIESLKKELSLSMEMNRQTQQQLLLCKEDLGKLQQQFQKDKLKKGYELQKKAEYLKQIKQLLENK